MRKWKRAVEQFFVHCLALLIYAVVYLLPMRGVRLFARAVGIAVYTLSWGRRRMMIGNIKSAFDGEMTPRRARYIAWRSVDNAAKTMVELCKMRWMTGKQLREAVKVEGAEHLDAVLEEGNGAILVTAHFGNWEWAGGRLAQMGYPINAVARAPYDDLMRELVDGARESKGIKLIGRRQVRRILRAIRNNECVAILPDQHAAVGVVHSTFLDRPADTAAGPATFAARTGAPIVPFFAPRDESDQIHCRILPALYVNGDPNREAVVKEVTQRINDLIGDQIRRDPVQWLWLHNRWKADNGQ